ncbi:FecR family protein [Methylocapsa acidiphila]|uniref:FecR family protein n=1 Tax=Methylocapsa acidiphila TaxID=133552 RepID=UPI0004219350|nr:FecR family protein [Methylocapsa acidiphila]
MLAENSSPDDKKRRAAAIEWWTRMKVGTLSAAEQATLESWLAEDEANRSAFAETAALWRELKAISRPAIRAAVAPTRQRPWRLAAASLFAVLVLFFGLGRLSLLWRADFSTGIGEVKVLTLEDGSRIHLNADTAIARNYSSRQRYVTLLKGEAWFEVAREPARPFTVEAAGGKTTAVGTSFDISIGRSRTEVTVTEHRVIVSVAGQNVTVEAGQQTAYGRDVPQLAAYSVDAGSETAWRRGLLIFQDKPLGDVIAAIDHYHHGFCLIIDPSIRDRRVTGVFRTAEPLESIRTIELSLGLNATYLGDYLILLRG